MKKAIATLVAGISLALAPVAAAAPIEWSGDLSVKYERDTAAGDPAVAGTMYTLRLKGEADLGADWSVYGRLAAQYATRPLLSDFNVDAYGPDRKSVAALDQFGFTHKIGQVAYKLGRQGVAVGTSALLYSRADSNIGRNGFVDGLTASGTVGVVDLAAAVVQEDNPGAQDNRIYAVRTGFNPSADLNWGLTLGRYQTRDNGSTNHWAVDGTYKFDKCSLTGEYTKSSRATDNRAYALTLNYGFDGRAAAYITNFRVETNGAMGQQSDFDYDNKGFYYGMTYKLSPADDLELVYKDQQFLSTGQSNTKFEATLTHAF